MAEAVAFTAPEVCPACRRAFFEGWQKLVELPTNKPRCQDVKEGEKTIPGCGRPYTGKIGKIDNTGDTKIMWDKDNPDEVDAARLQFEHLTKKGYLAYKAEGNKGEKGEKVTKFDPTAERLILTPPLRGG
jgi:hypothetical protein